MVSTFGRMNVLKRYVLVFFFGISSFPRLLLEVHLRKNFGYRYFKSISALTIGIPMLIYPIAVGFGTVDSFKGFLDYLLHYASWFGFMALFAYACVKRQHEVTHEPGVYDFAKVSDYSGDRNPILENLILFGKPVTTKMVITLIEPGIFFFIGLGLIIFKQPIGGVLLVCSIMYSLCYFGAIYLADESMMDTIDDIIRQEELANVIVKGRGPEKTRGFEMFCDFPESVDLRQKIFEAVQRQTEILQAY
ncbi:hypothetical protein BC343_14970 [Mucilaginibacter pedocola]|uniref:Uncharacterized protein n=2 Tax=Mucilaginibacter pedocola TaxID=1792845 RepID=A0A1S9P906_9SPHI|nr:hypothetical protein BC343_14970 [Mucilaginibacter pedocola]